MGSQERSSGPYPSQSTRYWNPVPRRRTSRSCLTVKAGALLMGRWGGGGWILGRIGSAGLDLRDVEHRVDTHGGRKGELNCNWVDYFADGKRSDELGSYFSGGVLKGRQILVDRLIDLPGIGGPERGDD